jgi:hypothetical protein
LTPNRSLTLIQFLTPGHRFPFLLKGKIGYDAVTCLPKHPSIAFLP